MRKAKEKRVKESERKYNEKSAGKRDIIITSKNKTKKSERDRERKRKGRKKRETRAGSRKKGERVDTVPKLFTV